MKKKSFSTIYQDFWSKYKEAYAKLSKEEQRDSGAIVLMLDSSGKGLGYSYFGSELALTFLLTKLFSDSKLRPIVETAMQCAMERVVGDPSKTQESTAKAWQFINYYQPIKFQKLWLRLLLKSAKTTSRQQ